MAQWEAVGRGEGELQPDLYIDTVAQLGHILEPKPQKWDRTGHLGEF